MLSLQCIFRCVLMAHWFPLSIHTTLMLFHVVPMESKVRRKLAAPESYYNVEGRYKARAIPSVPANSIALQHE
jgi:hypothetical protein